MWYWIQVTTILLIATMLAGYVFVEHAASVADIALIKLSSPVDLDDPNVETAELPKGRLDVGTTVTIPGWGVVKKFLDGRDVSTEILNFVRDIRFLPDIVITAPNLYEIKRSNCYPNFQALQNTTACPEFFEEHLCSVPAPGVSGHLVCNGDSGSFVGTKSTYLDRWVIYGVLSQTDIDCSPGSVAFSVDLLPLKQWIVDTINYDNV